MKIPPIFSSGMLVAQGASCSFLLCDSEGGVNVGIRLPTYVGIRFPTLVRG